MRFPSRRVADPLCQRNWETLAQPVPAARAQTTTFSVPHGLVTPVTLTTQIYDTDSIFSAGSRFTCKTAGLYSISAWVAQPGTSGQRYAYILYNGSVVLTTSMDTNAAGYTFSMSSQLMLKNGDYVEVAAFQNTGVTVANCSAQLAMFMVR